MVTVPWNQPEIFHLFIYADVIVFLKDKKIEINDIPKQIVPNVYYDECLTQQMYTVSQKN